MSKKVAFFENVRFWKRPYKCTSFKEWPVHEISSYTMKQWHFLLVWNGTGCLPAYSFITSRNPCDTPASHLIKNYYPILENEQI